MRKRRSLIYQISKKDFIELVNNSISYSDILRKIKLSSTGNSQKLLKRRILELELNIDHFNKYNIAAKLACTLPIEKVLVENSTYTRSALKKRLIKTGLLNYKCSECGNIGTWNNKKLSLHLDHINGVNNDNRLENLRFLCPNCHSQTDTWCAKHKKRKTKTIQINFDFRHGPRPLRRKVERPTQESLIELTNKLPFTSIGKMYSVSDVTIRKWCKSYKIDIPNRRGYWAKISKSQ